MTLEETIKYHKVVAEELRQEAEQIGDEDDIYVKYYRKCADEHEQLAEWLEELVELRKFTKFVTSEVVSEEVRSPIGHKHEIIRMLRKDTECPYSACVKAYEKALEYLRYGGDV